MSSDNYWQDALDKLELDYAECRIEKLEFVEGIQNIGITSETDIEMSVQMAEEARAEYKMDLARKKS